MVGDKLYMTQINDWYTNFSNYAGKSVEIEGYYMTFNNYKYVDRKGPTCPYCTGGYVNFEFQSDEDLSALVSESSCTPSLAPFSIVPTGLGTSITAFSGQTSEQPPQE